MNCRRKIRNSSYFSRILLHCLIWSSLVAMLSIFAYLRGMPVYNLHSVALPAGCMILFYLNYVWLIDRYFFTKKTVRFAVVNIMCFVLLSFSVSVIHEYSLDIPAQRPGFISHMHPGYPPVPPRRLPLLLGMPFFVNILLFILVVSAGMAIKATTRWYSAQAKMAALEKEKSAAELQQLKSQLNPHFLFNSLNNIYALIAFDPVRAQWAIHTLGDMLRHQLYEASQEKIPLRKEIDFIRSYCHIMQLRLPKNVKLFLDLPDNDHEIMIAPLLFAPLVENAFKHGLHSSKASRIAIAITITGGRSPVCTVRNSYFPKNNLDRSGSGIGLENLRKRLNLLYPGKYLWKTTQTDEEFITEITLNNE